MSLEYSSMSCCRVCLMTNCRLYDIHEYKLADALRQISGTPVSRDKLPQNLCAFCFVLLVKCSSFRDMCLRTQKLLKKEMGTDYIHRRQLPQRFLNLTQTEVEIIDMTSEKNLQYEPEEEMLIETLDEDAVVVETYMKEKNKIDPLFILKDDDKMTKKMKTDTSDDDMSIERLDDYSDIETLGGGTKISDTDVLKEGKNNKRKAATPKENEAIKNGKDCYRNVGTDKENKGKMKMLTIELKNNKLEFKVANDLNDIGNDGSNDVANDIGNNDSQKEEVKVDIRRKGKRGLNGSGTRNRFNPIDNEAFEKKYNHKIVTLSKEDQLEEIANRKKSRNYTETQFRCEDCGVGYNSEVTLYNHRVKHDPNISPHSCEICSMRFKNRNSLREHMNRNHRYRFICNMCNFVSRMRHQAKTHHEMHAGKTFDCQHCGKSFTKKSSYFSHVRLVHPEQNVVCAQCGETFVSNRGLREHKNRSHSVKFQCRTCSATFLSAEALSVHAETEGSHAGLCACEQCGDNYTTRDALREHVEEVHPPRHCEECDMTFTNPSAFDTHVRCKHHGKRPRHTWAKRKRTRTSTRPRYGRRAPEHKPCMCDQCGKSVPSAALLVYHMRKHLGEKPYACPHCPLAYVAKYLLNQHVRASHTSEKTFKCSNCDLAFKWKGNLRRHHQVAHLGIRGSFPCPVCGRTSTTKGSMKVHVRAVHGDAGWPKRDRSKRQKTQIQRPRERDPIQSDNDNNNTNIQSDSD